MIRGLAFALINLCIEKRSRRAPKILSEMVSAVATPFVALEGLEILFEHALEIVIVSLLQHLAHNRVVFALWPSEHSGHNLVARFLCRV